MTNWIEADTHYLHPNIILYCKRPYIRLDAGDVKVGDDGKTKWVNKERGRVRAAEMTADMIQDHNDLVAVDDTVWHLGDFCFGGTNDVVKLLRQLNGNFKFIWGNHDKPLHDFKKFLSHHKDLAARVEFLGNMAEVEIEGQPITLCHYSMRTWCKSHRGTWHLYGHSHGTLPDDPNSMSFDVGVDCHGLKPISFERVREIMKNKTFKPIDHHGK